MSTDRRCSSTTLSARSCSGCPRSTVSPWTPPPPSRLRGALAPRRAVAGPAYLREHAPVTPARLEQTLLDGLGVPAVPSCDAAPDRADERTRRGGSARGARDAQ